MHAGLKNLFKRVYFVYRVAKVNHLLVTNLLFGSMHKKRLESNPREGQKTNQQKMPYFR